MKMQKSISGLILLLLLLSVLGAGMAFAAGSPSPTLEKDSIVNQILWVGSLTFLFGDSPDNEFIGFLRILMTVLIFTLVYLGLSAIPGLTRGVAITISIILSILVSVFFPASILLAWGTTYATLFAFVIVFGPILGVAALLIMSPTPNRGIAFLKLVAVMALWWTVFQIGTWAAKLGSTAVGGF